MCLVQQKQIKTIFSLALGGIRHIARIMLKVFLATLPFSPRESLILGDGPCRGPTVIVT